MQLVWEGGEGLCCMVIVSRFICAQPCTAVITAYDRQRPEPWSHSSEMRMALPWPVKLTKQLLFRPCTVS